MLVFFLLMIKSDDNLTVLFLCSSTINLYQPGGGIKQKAILKTLLKITMRELLLKG